MTISHQDAVDHRLAERYLLGEMPEAEAEDFERHYFECQPCSVAVESGAAFIDNARAVFADPQLAPQAEASSKSWRQSLSQWWRSHPFLIPVLIPVTAAFALGAVALYQQTVLIPNLEMARPLPAFQLTGAARGDVPAIAIPASAPNFELSFDVPPDAQFSEFVDVLSKDGKDVFRVLSPAPALGQPISILLPTKKLQAGEYKLEVFGQSADGRQSSTIASYTFAFQSK